MINKEKIITYLADIGKVIDFLQNNKKEQAKKILDGIDKNHVYETDCFVLWAMLDEYYEYLKNPVLLEDHYIPLDNIESDYLETKSDFLKKFPDVYLDFEKKLDNLIYNIEHNDKDNAQKIYKEIDYNFNHFKKYLFKFFPESETFFREIKLEKILINKKELSTVKERFAILKGKGREFL